MNTASPPSTSPPRPSSATKREVLRRHGRRGARQGLPRRAPRQPRVEHSFSREAHEPASHSTWRLRAHVVAHDAASDGMYPLITNSDKTPTEVLITYKYQPNLERRNHCLKDTSGSHR